MRGRDIKRYSYEFADKWLIATFPARSIDIDEYPALKQYLFGFKPKLEQTGVPLTSEQKKRLRKHAKQYGIKLTNRGLKKSRKKTSNQWFETQDSIGYWQDFFKQKIMYSEIVREPQFYFDSEGEFYPEATIFIMTGAHMEYLYHLLHSKAVTYFFKKFYAGGGLGDDGYRYKKAFLKSLPIPKPTLESYNFSNLDKTISEIYGLDENELNFIYSQ